MQAGDFPVENKFKTVSESMNISEEFGVQNIEM